MNRRELLELIRDALGGTATQSAADLALSAVIRAIQDGLREDGEVKLARFGSFRLKKVAERRLLLPGSERSMVLPARKVLRFVPPSAPHPAKKTRVRHTTDFTDNAIR